MPLDLTDTVPPRNWLMNVFEIHAFLWMCFISNSLKNGSQAASQLSFAFIGRWWVPDFDCAPKSWWRGWEKIRSKCWPAHQKCEDHTCEDQRFAKEELKLAKSCNVSWRHHWHQSATLGRAGTGQFTSLQLSHAIFYDCFILSKILVLKQAEIAISCYLVLRGISLIRLMRQIMTTVLKACYK